MRDREMRDGDAGQRCGTEVRDRRNSPKWMIGRSPAQRLIRAAVLIHLGIISSVPRLSRMQEAHMALASAVNVMGESPQSETN
jgi:hypothetical protein